MSSRQVDPAVKRSAIRVVVLSLISLGIYQLYWFYITRQQLNAELGAKRSLARHSVAMQTFGPPLLGLFSVPLVFVFVGIVLLPVAIGLEVAVWYYLVKDISRLREDAKLSPIQPGLYVVGYIALSLLASGVGLVMLGLAAANLNEYWDKVSRGKAVEARYTAAEIIVSTIGLVLTVVGVIAAILLAVISNFGSTF